MQEKRLKLAANLQSYLQGRPKKIKYTNLCHKYYASNKFVGQGSHSTVFQASSPQQFEMGKKSSFIFKEIFHKGNGNTEVQASELGIAPWTEIFQCNERFYLVQKKMDGTFMDFYIDYPEKREEALQQVSELVKKWWSAGMVHSDLASGNIMFKKSKTGFRFYLIDFEYAKSYKNKTSEQIKKLLDKDRYITLVWPYTFDRTNSKVYIPGLPTFQQLVSV